ncbi:PREDICTED: brain acid soluble protein 1-like [Nelumbo nucifera]|uniref:Brain acid soluble protein 1-like n=1 Tax=Nelumbo nucifera TaxID=4432 RepID=A0A1U7YZA6_NELNU|nr:PREDICTED: brain acid soluble protein 1-like [Nelumbo nucifera]
MLSFTAGPMEAEKIDGQRLFRQMKRKKCLAKKARVESPQASAEAQPSQAPAPEPELPPPHPVIELEEDMTPQGPEMAAEPTTEPAKTVTRGDTGAAPGVHLAETAAKACPADAAAEASEESAHAVEMTTSSSKSQGVKVF